MASLQYAKDRLDYNHYSHAMSKKDRQKAYLALVYAQGCIKALEFVLGLADNFVKPTGSGVDQNDDN
jgi:23S rRNA-/tRNA-specific pseudouridylate synthase